LIIAHSEKRRLMRKKYPPGYLSTLKEWNLPLRLVLRLPSSVSIRRNCGRSLKFFSPVTMAF
jgi:hypothetical protein